MIKSKVKIKSKEKDVDLYEDITAVSVTEYEPKLLFFKSIQRNHKYIDYATEYITLDTETSHLGDEDSWIYQWAVKFNGDYIYGRTPSEIIDLFIKIAEYYSLNDKKKIICYIHNASYDVQYLKHFLARYDPRITMLAIDTHTILEVNILGFKILCSYKLSNMSLAMLSKSYAKKYIKAVGEIDYNIVRYQDTELTESDWLYMFSDVASQHDGIQGYINAMGYKYVYECPITSTGFVRVSCRTAANAEDGWRDEFTQSALNYDQYTLCTQAFMGGVTICSYRYSGVTVRSDKLRHKDFTSSYPARQMINYMPRGMPIEYGDVEDTETFNDLLNNYCCIFVIELHDVHIKQGITAPYIPSSKLIDSDQVLKCNGKVVYANMLQIAICELDWSIIKRQYKFDKDNVKVGHMLLFERGEAPEWLKKEVMQYFKGKCELKGVDEYMYMRSKAFLNSIYGMTATKILREVFKLDSDLIITHTKEKEQEQKEKILAKYYKSYNSFMPYQLAIYTTAWARFSLFEMLERIGYENFLYCDTDSAFYLETPENKIKMEQYAEECRQDAIKHNAFIGNKFLGEPTDEPKIRAFRGLHAKCYAMEEWDDDAQDYILKVTIAGIPKKATKWIDGKAVTMTNAEELGSIDKLEDGFTFKHCGGTRAIYNERPIEIKTINGHRIELASNVIIYSIEKEISDTMWTHDGLELQNILYSEVV